MGKQRAEALLRIVKGMAAAVTVTLLSIAGLVAALLWLGLSDAWLRIANQLVKAASIIVGVLFAVGRGGHRGFITGMTLAMAYMLLGYALYIRLGGAAYDTADMLGEILLGAALGGIAGAVLANLPSPRSAHA